MELKERIKNHSLYKKTLENRYLAIFLLLVIILMTYSYFKEGIVYQISDVNLEGVKNFINSFGNFSWIIYVLTLILISIFPVPSTIINVAGSLSFGPLNAVFLTLIGAVLGNSIDYFIARRYGYEHIKQIINEKRREKFDDYSKKYGYLVLFILRLNPLTSTDIFSYLSGLIGMPFKKFLLSTIFGILPGIIFVSYFGSRFINDNKLFRLTFVIITMFYALIMVYLILRFLKKKVKERFVKK